MKRAVSHSAVWLVFPLWLLFVGITLGRVAFLVHYNHEFLAEKRAVEGRVIAKAERLVDHFTNGRVFVVIYSYQAENVAGTIRTGVDRRTFDRVKVGGPIPVAYLPGDARQHCIDYPWELSDRDNAPLDVFAVAMAGFVPGLVLIIYFARRNRIHSRLMRSGAQTWGEVTDVKKTHTRYGSHSYVVLRFTSADGREIAGRSAALPDSEHHHWQAGDPIEVTYDAKRPWLFAVDTRHPLDGALAIEPPPRTHETIWA